MTEYLLHALPPNSRNSTGKLRTVSESLVNHGSRVESTKGNLDVAALKKTFFQYLAG
jgi:hypothetical protein